MARRTGYELRRVAAPKPRTEHDVPRPPSDPEHDRLLREPVFLLSSVRSGSTLLRLMLNSHPLVHAPHETHVRRLVVEFETPPVRQAMETCGHRRTDLEHLLWDRVLHRELARSGMTIFLVVQNADHALKLSDRAYVMVTGEIRMSGSGEELLGNQEVRNAYLGGH